MTRTCVICGALYDTHRPHQKTCGDAECKAENNRRRCRMNYTPEEKPPKRELPEFEPCTAENMDTGGAKLLCAALIWDARHHNDKRFFQTELYRMIEDSVDF